MGRAARSGTAPRAGNRIAACLSCRRYFRALRTGALGAGEPACRRQRAVSCRALADLRGDRDARRERRTVAAHVDQRGRVRVWLCDRELIGRGDRLCHGRNPTMKRVLQPWISGLYATPTIALAPLFILWLGIGIWSKVLVVIFLVLFPVTINTEAGLRTTSERLIEMLRSFG